eukprot:1123743-Rhodomonas_salina.1
MVPARRPSGLRIGSPRVSGGLEQLSNADQDAVFQQGRHLQPWGPGLGAFPSAAPVCGRRLAADDHRQERARKQGAARTRRELSSRRPRHHPGSSWATMCLARAASAWCRGSGIRGLTCWRGAGRGAGVLGPRPCSPPHHR